jgi:hypothetical protein
MPEAQRRSKIEINTICLGRKLFLSIPGIEKRPNLLKKEVKRYEKNNYYFIDSRYVYRDKLDGTSIK